MKKILKPLGNFEFKIIFSLNLLLNPSEWKLLNWRTDPKTQSKILSPDLFCIIPCSDGNVPEKIEA